MSETDPSNLPSNPPSDPPRAPGRREIARYAPLALILAALAVAWASGVTQYLTLEELLTRRAQLAGFIADNRVTALAAYVAIYIVAVALSVPGGLVLTLTGGVLFGAIGGVAAVFAATIGATLLFLAARTSLGETLASRAGPWIGRLREGFREGAVYYMLFLRLTPVFPFWLVNLAPALLGVPLRTFVWTTLVGVAPATMAFALAGAGVDSVVAEKKAAYDACLAAGAADCDLRLSGSDLLTQELMLGLAAVGMAALIPVVVQKIRKRRAASAPAREQT